MTPTLLPGATAAALAALAVYADIVNENHATTTTHDVKAEVADPANRGEVIFEVLEVGIEHLAAVPMPGPTDAEQAACDAFMDALVPLVDAYANALAVEAAR